jgi:hypothetical protein
MSGRGRVFIELLSVMARLAGDVPGLSDEQVRAALVALGDRAARLLKGETR